MENCNKLCILGHPTGQVIIRMDSSTVFMTFENNEELDARKNMGLLCYFLKCVRFPFPIGIFSSCRCLLMTNANILDTDLRSTLFNIPLATPTLLNKVLSSLSFLLLTYFLIHCLHGFCPRYFPADNSKIGVQRNFQVDLCSMQLFKFKKTFQLSMVASHM